MKTWTSASVIFLMVCSYQMVSATEPKVCFSKVQLGKLERLKAIAKARKKHIKLLERQIVMMKANAAKARRERLNMVIRQRTWCRCIVPWVIAGVTLGGCAAGMVAVGVTR